MVLFLSNIKEIHCGEFSDCYYYSNLEYIYNETCFNNIIIFDQKYKTGNFAINKNGDLIIEFYSEDENYSKRLFYGMTKDGRYYFLNQTSYTQELNINIDEIIDISGYYNFFNIYNSKNLFVTIKNDRKTGNEYLFSINSYDSIVELHNFTNNNSSYYLWNFNDFFNLNEDDYFFPYETSLFELKKESAYIISFIPKIDINEDLSGLSFIKKFRFKSFDRDAYEEIKSVEYTNYINKTILSVLLMDDSGLLVVLTSEKKLITDESNNNQGGDDNNVEYSERRVAGSGNYIVGNYLYIYGINFYSNNLRIMSSTNNKQLDLSSLIYYYGNEIYFKAIYLKKEFAIFIYISYNKLVINLFKLNYLNGGQLIQYDDNIYIVTNFLDEF